MSDRIYLLGGEGQIEPLQEAPYESEDTLQALIADHPEILAGEQMTPDEPRRWLLITREMGIADSAETGNRWAVDHLLIDQDAVPTLVEVKRGDNPEVRRSVVGQLLEYAAHASRYWPIESIRAAFQHSVEKRGQDPSSALAELLQLDGEPDADAFWESVATNLAARRMRLLFVADEIPDPLAHVVEFLNEQMPTVEVLAVELKQFQGDGVRTLVPRVIGRTVKGPSGAARPTITRERFLDEFAEGAVRDAATRLLEAARASGAVFEWGSRGVSIRGRCPVWKQPVTVAWLYPTSAGWARTRHFSFGSGIVDYPDLPPELHSLVRRYVARFSDDSFVQDASSQGVMAWSVEPEDAALHIDLLEERLRTILKELAELSPD